jgi:hypothetical protein
VRPTNNPLRFAVSLGIFAAMLFSATTVLAQDNPAFMVTSPLNAATPFTVTLPSTTPAGNAVKTVEIQFVSADCDATPGATVIGSAQVTVTFTGQNGFYHLGFGPPQVFVNTTEFVISQTTLMFADPGSPVNFGVTGLSPTCTVVFSGHLIPK